MNDENQNDPGWQPMESRPPGNPATHNGQSDQYRAGSTRIQTEPISEPRQHASSSPPPSIDPFQFVEVLLHRWRWLLLGGATLATLAGLAGLVLWKKSFTAVALLLRYEPMGMSDYFKPRELTSDTFSGLLKSPELLQRVATNAQPSLSAEALGKIIYIKPEPESDIVKVGVKGKAPQEAVALANLYAEEAVRFMRDLQQREAMEVNKNYLKEQLGQMDRDISTLQEQFKRLPNTGPMASRLNQIGGTVSNLTQQLQSTPRMSIMTTRLNERLQLAIDDLMNLTRVYSDANPKVLAQKQYIETLKTQISQSATNADGQGIIVPGTTGNGGPLPPGTVVDPVYDIIRSKLQALDNSRQILSDRQREAQAFAANPPGNVRMFAPATIKGVIKDRRMIKVGIAGVFGGLLGVALSACCALLVEFLDNRLKTADDVRRVTRLPVIATLDDLRKKGPSARERWAFRTWMMLQGRLSPSANRGLICGVTSSQAGEGRSTWINLLAEAASMSGFRVLTIATRPTTNGEEYPESGAGPANGANGNGNHTTMLTTNVLATPAEVTEQLSGPNPQPMVHIPIPGWVWNLERRMQWKEALNHWSRIDNVVILVELPPASTSEAVLLGQNLPNLIWLTNSGSASAAETRMQLETLRHARCRLVGAVLNQEASPPLKSRFPRWLGCVTVGFLAWSAASSAQAGELKWPVEEPPMQLAAVTTNVAQPASETPVTNSVPVFNSSAATNITVTISPGIPSSSISNTPPATNVSFSVLSSSQRAEWQKRLTLGPGDILNFSLYGSPELTKNDVFIGPDGRVGYLEAQNVLATGLTVDELREKIDKELANYRRAPRTIITPVLYQSKKYYMLGKVVQRGVYTLDRPITIVEAVARAHGLETGLSDRNVLDLADFQRSFLARRGQRMPIDFEKLFEQGDLSQNVALEPDDYLYFPSASVQEVYVLGEVLYPGVVPYTRELTIIGALAGRGGFNDRAYKSRVLVIRGSLQKPKYFVVDTRAILDAQGQDFRLEAKDIIYVSSRPFIRVEDLINLGVTAFIQSVTAEWTGKHIGPLITSPIFTAP